MSFHYLLGHLPANKDKLSSDACARMVWLGSCDLYIHIRITRDTMDCFGSVNRKDRSGQLDCQAWYRVK